MSAFLTHPLPHIMRHDMVFDRKDLRDHYDSENLLWQMAWLFRPKHPLPVSFSLEITRKELFFGL